jgi:putative addiction module component (TIGR02574 family)
MMQARREQLVRQRFAQRMESLPGFSPACFGEGYETFPCYVRRGVLNCYVTLQITPNDESFSLLLTWMTTNKPPISATPGAPNGEPNSDGLTVDLTLLWNLNATPWKVKYSPSADKVAAWSERHPDEPDVLKDQEKLKIYYYLDESIDKLFEFGLPYFQLAESRYGQECSWKRPDRSPAIREGTGLPIGSARRYHGGTRGDCDCAGAQILEYRLMNSVLEQWKTQLGTLSPGDRAELAHFLLSSLEPEDEGAEAAWDAEASRRVKEIHSGHAPGRAVDDLLAELREQYP